MISFEEALKLIEGHCRLTQEEQVPLAAALGCVNSRDVYSPRALPGDDNSAMDGFVFRFEDTKEAQPEKPALLQIKGTLKAGDPPVKFLRKNEAYKIMTGALVPHGGNTVMAKENVTVFKNRLVLNQPVPRGQHIRYRGEEIKKNERVLSKGQVINPGSIGFLAMMGMKNIMIYKKPRISLIATGSELLVPGVPLRPGKIYDSNTCMIQAALDQVRIRPVFTRHVSDHYKAIKRIIDFSLAGSDIVILMGGVSAGEYDHVRNLLGEAGVKTVFWKVSQKPGKPLYFGKKGQTLVFGLPGNPAAVFTCFYEYVYPAIRRRMGYSHPYLYSEKIGLGESVKSDPKKCLFLKAKVRYTKEKSITLLGHQKSHMISALCEADSLIALPASDKFLKKGEKVSVHFLPYSWEGKS